MRPIQAIGRGLPTFNLRLAVLLFLAVAALALIACGDDDDDDSSSNSGNGGGAAPTEAAGGNDAPTAEPEAEAEDLSGTIQIDGSSTVFPITEAVAEEFNGVEPGVQVPVGVSGTGGGFERFCGGETDISDASRPIADDEIPICEAAGIEFIEIPVAYDGLSVVKNPANDWVSCLSVEQLTTIWHASAEGTITSWSDIDPSWPDQELVLFGPGTDSGTFDYFDEVITDGEHRPDYTPSEDDNVLVQGVAGDEGALGYFGLAYLEANRGTIDGIEIDGGEGCVAPMAETVESGEYQPLSRPLFIYVKVESADKPEVQAFVNFYLENVPALSGDVGYVRFPDNFYQIITERWTSRTTGSVFSGASGSVGEILGAN
jgi:phosphate transport system substrate-binding protein